jgi:hypothetical protein
VVKRIGPVAYQLALRKAKIDQDQWCVSCFYVTESRDRPGSSATIGSYRDWRRFDFRSETCEDFGSEWKGALK